MARFKDLHGQDLFFAIFCNMTEDAILDYVNEFNLCGGTVYSMTDANAWEQLVNDKLGTIRELTKKVEESVKDSLFTYSDKYFAYDEDEGKLVSFEDDASVIEYAKTGGILYQDFLIRFNEE